MTSKALSPAVKRSLERATEAYASHVARALPYLEGRGIDKAAALEAGLGVVTDPLPGHEFLTGRLSIPYITDAGTVNMTFRCIKNHDCKTESKHQKYLLWPKLPSNLYHAQSLQAADEWIAVAEGEIDALTLNISGIPAVGISGVEKWRDYWPLIFDDFTRIYFFEDGDDPGKKLGDKMVHEINSPVIRIKMPSGQDVNSIYVAQGPEALVRMVRHG